MRHPDRTHFDRLRLALVTTFKKVLPDAPDRIQDWNLKTIERFQEHLMEVAHGRVSTKWFYTHLKGEHERLPRIDVLNLLSQYVGAESWEEFCGQETAEPVVEKAAPRKQGLPKGTGSIIGVAIAAVVLFLAMNLDWSPDPPVETTYEFCLQDADLGGAIRESNIEVVLLRNGESDMMLPVNGEGCCLVATTADKVSLVIQGGYYRTDTIVRTLNPEQTSEVLKVRADDYAMMIDIFSRSKLEDWERRRRQLDDMFAEEARIFQVNPGTQRGMELYNKQEFIDKLTVPVNSLRNIRVLNTEYRNGQIVGLRFVQEEE